MDLGDNATFTAFGGNGEEFSILAEGIEQFVLVPGTVPTDEENPEGFEEEQTPDFVQFIVSTGAGVTEIMTPMPPRPSSERTL